MRRVIHRKSSDLIYFAAEAWNQVNFSVNSNQNQFITFGNKLTVLLEGTKANVKTGQWKCIMGSAGVMRYVGTERTRGWLLSWRWKQNLLPKDLHPRIELHDIVTEVGGGWEEYVGQCNRNERTALDWLRTGIWKLGSYSVESIGGIWPLGLTEENAVHKFLTYLLTPWSRVLLEKLTSKLCS